MLEVNLRKVFQMGTYKYIIPLELSTKLLGMKYFTSREPVDDF